MLAACAALWHAALMTRAANDNFMHMTFAQQWLAGDWPIRDFFDHGWILQYSLSALAQVVFGERLIGEALIVGVAWAVATYAVFHTVRQTSGSTLAACLAGLLLILAGARGYSYPKGVVYAVAAALWWGYVRTPTWRRMLAFGAWAAAAFLWRPDHGIYVACGIVLAAWAAHGLRPIALVRSALAGASMLALVAPFLLYVQLTAGLTDYVSAGLVLGRVEHTTHGPHQWPLLRFGRDLWRIEPAGAYAPAITLRWTTDSTPDERAQILARYGLTPLSTDGDTVHASLSAQSFPVIGGLVGEPVVEDTGGIDRSTGVLTAPWPTLHRWKFSQAWLRVRWLPQLDPQPRASEFAVALFYGLPVLLVLGAPWMSQYFPRGVTESSLVAFAAFAFLLDVAMLRSPFPARAADAVVGSAVVFGLCVVWMWRAAAAAGWLRVVALRFVTLLLVGAMTASVAGAGRFRETLAGLAGQWTSPSHARGAWTEVYRELTASPPLAHYRDRPARLSLRLAAYVRECVPPSDRLLVLWFEPEIYYYSGRLMAQRHLIFAPAWAEVPHEQRMTLEKIRRYRPPVALARQSSFEYEARATYPAVVDDLERDYRLAGTIADGGDEYRIFARRDRPVARAFGPEGWPCFVGEAGSWSRVGQPVG